MEQNQKRALPPMDGLEALRQENARLRAELSSLIFARDELLLYCRELENTCATERYARPLPCRQNT